MPDPVAPPAAPDAPAVMSQEEITAEAVRLGTEAAAHEDGPPVPAEPPEPVEGEPPTEPEAPAEPAEPEPPAEPEAPAETEPPAEPVELTEEQQDRADAKELGFKNMKATEEFVKMRAELRELRPLQDKLADTEPLAERWSKVYSYCQTHDIDADNFAAGMAMIAGTKSKDPAVMLKTIEGLEWEADRLRQKMGVAGGSYDPLKEPGNADLARAVEDGEVTQAFAHQTARLRAENAHRTNLDTTRQQQSAQQQETAQARAAATDALNATEAEYMALDPLYEQKSALLVPLLKPLFARIPPSEWDAEFRRAYKEVRLPASAAPPPAAAQQPPPLRNQPLRAGSSPTGKVGEIKTEAEAIAAAMAAAAQIDGVPNRHTA